MIRVGEVRVGDIVTFGDKGFMLLVIRTEMVSFNGRPNSCQNFDTFNLTTGCFDQQYGVVVDNSASWHFVCRLEDSE